MKWKTIREQKAQSAECDSVFVRLLNSIQIFDVPPSSFRHYIFNCLLLALSLSDPNRQTKTKRKREKTEHRKKSQTKSNKNNHMNRYVDEWMLLSRYEILLSKHYSLREWFDSMVESSMCVCVWAPIFSLHLFRLLFLHNIAQHTITRIKNHNSFVYLTHCHSYADTLIQYTRKHIRVDSFQSHHIIVRIVCVCVCGFWVTIADGCFEFLAMERWQMDICFSICDVKEKSCFLSFYLSLVVRSVVFLCVR